ncbi:FAD-dependent oxidoreductase [Flavobacterium sp. LHD-85]|uniref:FAD-dependent oxidoreductase n=1 Tax=Flavobacterium sp. LHD-85 TaxID=3071410 RepID=UPI0027DEC63D|nr:FAD-dependent oxidoreductase [Flavobacterium sp. LHD-85]MDQ6531950.1 FAD-dependent oxidoreductase [Flavobacterium sp. LHD-85]
MKKVLIIGAGVSGLTTAYCLAEAGYKVKVLSKEFSPDITSNVAGALWEWPPAVCGYHSDLVSLERSKEWCMRSYDKFYQLAEQKETGVYLRQAFFFFRDLVKNDAFQLQKMNEIKKNTKGFDHDASFIEKEGINPNIGLVDAYCYEAPMVDTDTYMEWIMQQVLLLGAEVIQGDVNSDLISVEKKLKKQYQCDYIINCTGLGSIKLANEVMHPLRGALVRIKNNGVKFAVLNKAYCVSFDQKTQEQNIVFIVPRGENHVILGALAEEDQWDKNINLENYEPIREMFRRCKEFLPILEDAELDENEPVRVGLRPLRKGNVRLAWEENSSIIHNYGHGGSGVTFSWGCAQEIVTMITNRIRFENNAAQLETYAKKNI